MSWTTERIELLGKLWNEGLSASQVAAELGPGVTRNAVIGKLHRLGLAERAKAPSQPRARAARPPRPPSQTQPQGPGGLGGGLPGVMGNVALALAPQALADPSPKLLAEAVVVPISARVTLMDLRETMCRWPLGDPATSDFRFCGAKSPIGASVYCAFHASVAYQPAQDRRRIRDQPRTARLA